MREPSAKVAVAALYGPAKQGKISMEVANQACLSQEKLRESLRITKKLNKFLRIGIIWNHLKSFDIYVRHPMSYLCKEPFAFGKVEHHYQPALFPVYLTDLRTETSETIWAPRREKFSISADRKDPTNSQLLLHIETWTKDIQYSKFGTFIRLLSLNALCNTR